MKRKLEVTLDEKGWFVFDFFNTDGIICHSISLPMAPLNLTLVTMKWLLNNQLPIDLGRGK